MEGPQQIAERLRRFAKQLQTQAENSRKVPWPSTVDIDTAEMLAKGLLERLDGKYETLDSALGLSGVHASEAQPTTTNVPIGAGAR